MAELLCCLNCGDELIGKQTKFCSSKCRFKYRDKIGETARYFKERRKEMKKRIIEYLGGECIFCGYKKCDAALDCHHTEDDKDIRIASMTHYSWERVKKEIDKCILVVQIAIEKYIKGVCLSAKEPGSKLGERELNSLHSFHL